VAPILPRFDAGRRERERATWARTLAELEADEVETPATLLRASADGHDHARRRGLPLISRGVTGAIPGSSPVAALLAKERSSSNGRR